MAPHFLAKKKTSYFAGYIAKEIVKEEVVTENFHEPLFDRYLLDASNSTNSIQDAWIFDDISY